MPVDAKAEGRCGVLRTLRVLAAGFGDCVTHGSRKPKWSHESVTRSLQSVAVKMVLQRGGGMLLLSALCKVLLWTCVFPEVSSPGCALTHRCVVSRCRREGSWGKCSPAPLVWLEEMRTGRAHGSWGVGGSQQGRGGNWGMSGEKEV